MLVHLCLILRRPRRRVGERLGELHPRAVRNLCVLRFAGAERTKSSGIDTCRDEDVYRSILGPTCIEDALDAGHGDELRALDLTEAQVRLLFPCPSADLSSCAKGGRLKLLKVLPLVHR